MKNKYISKYNCEFNLPNNYNAVSADKSVFENALVKFSCGDKFDFQLLFEGTTVQNSMAMYFDFVKIKYNSDGFSIKSTNYFEFFRSDSKTQVMECVIHFEPTNEDFVCYFFKYDERFNYVGAFAFKKQVMELEKYREISTEVFASMSSALKKLEENY